MSDHANVHVSQSLFTDHMWQEISKASPRRWGRPDVDLFVKEIFRQLGRALSHGYVLEIQNFGVFRVVSTNEVRHGMPGRPGEVHTFPPRCVALTDRELPGPAGLSNALFRSIMI